MSEHDTPVESERSEYEPPSLAPLGSTAALTAEASDDVTTIEKESDARLKTDVAPVAGAVERLRRLGAR